MTQAMRIMGEAGGRGSRHRGERPGFLIAPGRPRPRSSFFAQRESTRLIAMMK